MREAGGRGGVGREPGGTLPSAPLDNGLWARWETRGTEPGPAEGCRGPGRRLGPLRVGWTLIFSP